MSVKSRLCSQPAALTAQFTIASLIMASGATTTYASRADIGTLIAELTTDTIQSQIADIDPVTQPTLWYEPPVSFSIMPATGLVLHTTISAFGQSAGLEADSSESSKGYESGENYLGEKITGASTRYVEDFETGEIGSEWASPVSLLSSQSLTQFADPSAGEGLMLNIATKEEEVYEIRLDVYLIPPATSKAGGGEDEDVESALIITVDGEEITSISPSDLRKRAGATAQVGQPLIRQVRFNFTASHGISSIKISGPAADATRGWSSWGVDNLVVDLGLQDPVFGFFGKAGDSDRGIFGMQYPGSDLNGQIPGPPRSRYGSNEPFAGSGGGGGGSPTPRVVPDPEVPSPGGTALLLLAGFGLLRRERR